MASVVTPLFLSIIDKVRGIPDTLGLRPYTITRRVRTWSGERPGVPGSSFVDSDLILTNEDMLGGPAHRVRVRPVTEKEIVASGGLYAERDLKVGPMTPAFAATRDVSAAGGFTGEQIDPVGTSSTVEILWLGQASFYPPGGLWFDLIGTEYTSLHIFVVLRQKGRVA